MKTDLKQKIKLLTTATWKYLLKKQWLYYLLPVLIFFNLLLIRENRELKATIEAKETKIIELQNTIEKQKIELNAQVDYYSYLYNKLFACVELYKGQDCGKCTQIINKLKKYYEFNQKKGATTKKGQQKNKTD